MKKSITTKSVRAGLCSDKENSALVPPIYLSTTFEMDGFEKKGKFDYSRSINPTRCLLADAIAELEFADNAIITNTGMSAITVVCQLLDKDDLLIIPHDCYGGTYRLFTNLAKRGLFKLEIINQSDNSQLEKALAEKAKMIWLETPSNPVMRVVDIKKISTMAQKHNTLVAVDNTFLSPIFQNPLELGANIVVHSATKFLNGHSDIVCGAIASNGVDLGEQLKWWANCIGATGSAFDSYMVMRGIRTLAARMKIHQRNAKKIVKFLKKHKKVKTIYYPGLKSHPDHKIAKEQQLGFGSMLSFELIGGKDSVIKILENLNIFTLAQSLGGVESLINHPATMTHAAMDEQARLNAGVTDGLLRLSVGIELVDDLISDLEQALDKI